MVRGLHAGLARHLLARIDTESAFFEMSYDALRAVGGLPERMADSAMRADLLRKAADEERFVRANDIEALYFAGSDYPTRLTECADGPTMLYKLGNADLESRHVVGIVGTRNATSYGVDTATKIVSELNDRLDSLVIVSGLAYGIDVAAHKAALSCNVPTVAVSAHPLNSIYPADHRGVAVKMIEAGGALVSEYPTSSVVHRNNFLERNRIIAGLCDVVIVVESDIKGGAMVTAHIAADYDREVYAVPGRLCDTRSRGCNFLIAKNRAAIYTDVDDLVESMGWHADKVAGQQKEMTFDLSPEEQTIIDYLVNNPGATQSEIMLATKISPSRLKDTLFNMEMCDMVMCMAGGKYTALTT